MTTPSRPNLAVLIDAENVSAVHAEFVFEKAADFGKPTDRRAYGDWTTTQLMPWKRVLNRWGIRPHQQFRYRSGKNSSDGALIIEAMDLLHGGCVDGFCLVSSDSDYIGLAARIRAQGMVVYGFGDRTTMVDFVRACDEFVYVDGPAP